MATETLQVKAIVDGVNAFVSDVGKAAKSVQDAGKKIETAAKDFDSATGDVEALGSALDATSSAAKNVKLDAAGKEAKDVGSEFEDAAPQVESITESFDEVEESADALDLSPASDEAGETADQIATAGETAESFADSLEGIEQDAGAFDVSEAADEAEASAQVISDAGDTAEGFSDALKGIETDAGSFDVSAASDEAESVARDIGDADASGFSDSLADIETDAGSFDISDASDTAETTAAAIGDAGSDAERFTDSLDTVETDAGAFDVSAAEDSAESTAQAIGDAGSDAERFTDSLDTVEQDAGDFDVSVASDTAETTAAAIGDAGSDAERFSDSLDIVEQDAESLDLSPASTEAENIAAALGDAGEDAERFTDSLDTIEDDAASFDVSDASETAESTAQAIGNAGADAEVFIDSLDAVQDSADSFSLDSASEEADSTAAEFTAAGTEIEGLATSLEEVQSAADSVDLTGPSADAQQAGTSFGFLGTTVKGIVAGLTFATLAQQLQDAAAGAAADEQATARLTTVIRNSGEPLRETIAILDELILKGQDLAFTDDEVRNSFSRLLVATDSAEQAVLRLNTAFDFARGAGISLEAASRLLGKINEENVDVFKKLGIELEDNATEMEALAVVQAKFGGSAETHVANAAGQWEVLTIKISEAKEALGALILTEGYAIASGDAVEKSSSALGQAMDFLGGKGVVANTVFRIWAEQVMPGSNLAYSLLKIGADDASTATGGFIGRLVDASIKLKAARDEMIATRPHLDYTGDAFEIGRGKIAEYATALDTAEQSLKDLERALNDVEQEFITNNPAVIAAKGQIALYRLELNDLKTKSGELTGFESARVAALESSIGVLENVIKKEQGHADAIQDVTGFLATFVGNAGMGRLISVLSDGETSLGNQTQYVADLGQAFLNAKSGGIDAAIEGMATLQSNLGPMSAEWQAIAQEVGPKFIATLKEGITDPAKLAEIDAAGVALGIEVKGGLESTTGEITDAGTLLVTAAKDAIEAGASDLENAGMILGEATNTGVGSLADKLKATGSDLGTKLGEGVEAKEADLKDAGIVLSDAVKTGTTTDLTPTGESAGEGLAQGLRNREGSVSAAASALAARVIAAMQGILKPFSPAKAIIPIGESVAEGLEVGMANRITFVQLATDKLTEEGIIDPLTAAAIEIEAIGKAIGLDTTEAIRFAFATGADDAYQQLDTFLSDLLGKLGVGRQSMQLTAVRSVLDVVDAFAEKTQYKPGTDQMFEFAHEMVVVLRDAPLPAEAKAVIQATISTIMADLHAGKIDAAAAMTGVKDAMLDILLLAGTEIPDQASIVTGQILSEMNSWITTLNDLLRMGKELSATEIESMFAQLSGLITASDLGADASALADTIISEFINGLRSGQGVANQAVADFIAFLIAQISGSVAPPSSGGAAATNWIDDAGNIQGPRDPVTGKPLTKPKGMSQWIYDHFENFYPQQRGTNTDQIDVETLSYYEQLPYAIGAAEQWMAFNPINAEWMQVYARVNAAKAELAAYLAAQASADVHFREGGITTRPMTGRLHANEAVVPLDRFYDKLDDLISTASMIALNTQPVSMFGGSTQPRAGSNVILDLRYSSFGSSATETAGAIERMIDRRFDAGVQRHMMGALRDGVRAR